jgi:hypothetical protein
MTPRDFPSGDSRGDSPSRRALLRVLTVAPVVVPAIVSPWREALISLHRRYDDEPVTLARSPEGRNLSRDFYHSAEIEMESVELGFFSQPRFIRTALHRAGSIAKLALCAYLLDVGFPDAWNVEHIRQDVAKALTYANATGFGHDCPDVARLAVILSPFWKWGYPHLIGDPPVDDGGYSPDQVRLLLRALLDRVHDVTGHPRPKGWHRHQRDVRS